MDLSENSVLLRELVCACLRSQNQKIDTIALLLPPPRYLAGNKQGEDSAVPTGVSFFSEGITLPAFKQGQASSKLQSKNQNRIWKCFEVDH